MRRRDVLARLAGTGAVGGLAAGLSGGLAGCTEGLPGGGGSNAPGEEAPATPEVQRGQAVPFRALRVRNVGETARYLTAAIYRGGRALSSASRDLAPGDALLFPRTVHRSGRYRVVVEGDGLRAERGWVVDDSRGDLLVRVGEGVRTRQDVHCGPDCPPFAEGVAADAWPDGDPDRDADAADDPGDADATEATDAADGLSAPATVYVTAPEGPLEASIAMDRSGARLLEGELALAPARRLVVEGLVAPGPLDVAIETGEARSVHRWPAVARSELHAAVAPTGATFDCGDGNPTVVCRNYDSSAHQLTLTVRDGSRRIERRRVGLEPDEIAEIRAAPASGRYRLVAETGSGGRLETRWSVCPPHLGTMVTVERDGSLSVTRGRAEPPASAWGENPAGSESGAGSASGSGSGSG